MGPTPGRARWIEVAVLAFAALMLAVGGWAAAAAVGRQHVLAAFTTDLAGRSAAQRTNIALSVARLDGVVVPRGAAFSFNEVVGQRLLEQGYEKAPAFEGGGVSMVAGGGVCQVSSTVYNAALLAGMRILERSPHVSAVRSVGRGRDAAVLYGKWDLRWSNPYPFTVCVRGRVQGDRLVVEILGARPRPVTVSVTEDVARTGTAQTWRRVGARTELISEDRYLP